jgi:predicted nucleotide-binding protein
MNFAEMKEDKNRKLFVVHGRNETARDALFQFLRAICLEPIEFSQAIKLTGKGSPFIGEILDKAFEHAQAVVVLLTGDDEVRLRKDFYKPNEKDYEKNFYPQARPNVLFEAGMAFGVHQDRTVLVQLGEIKSFSDIAGRHIIIMDNTSEKRHELAQRLKSVGCAVNTDGSEWLKSGKFEAIAYNNSISDHSITDNNAPSILSTEQISILKILSIVESADYNSMKFSAIKGVLKREYNIQINKTKLIYFLDNLFDYNYISIKDKIDSEYYYCIAPKGREFLVTSNLI